MPSYPLSTTRVRGTMQDWVNSSTTKYYVGWLPNNVSRYYVSRCFPFAVFSTIADGYCRPLWGRCSAKRRADRRKNTQYLFGSSAHGESLMRLARNTILAMMSGSVIERRGVTSCISRNDM